MSKYSAFYGRHKNKESKQQSLKEISKRQAHFNIMNSPTRVSVDYLVLEEQKDRTFDLKLQESKPAIVSDKENFHKRIVLWRPDDDVPLGAYLEYDKRTYLTTGISDIDIYPQSFVEHCNYDFLIKEEPERIIVDYDERGRPIYDYIEIEYTIPCVVTSKIYSALDNSQISLPTGAILVYVPYHERINIPVNYEFEFYGDKYKVTTVSNDELIKDKDGVIRGCLELSGQREQGAKKK